MATVKSTLSLEDKMSSTLKAIQAASKQTGSGFDSLRTKLDGLSKSANSSSSILKGVLGANIIQKGIGMITNQIGSAINRFDTLNNYTNVMEGLGFGAAESQASINRLKDGLDGLPTTLDDAVSSVQRFAAVNNNIKASTEMTLALNDALAAGGTPAATQAAALEQISQAYAKGKFDAMEYKSMMNAMPAQLKQVAKEMGYTSTALGGDFYNALQKGKIGMNDMMNTMMKLDKKTGGFHDQAMKATAGIGTAFINMKTAITKGLTKLIENINNALARANLPSIQEMIKNTGKALENMLSTVGTVIGNIIDWISPAITFIRDNINTIIVVLGVLIGMYVAWEGVTWLVTAAQWALNAAQSANPIGIIIMLIAALIIILLLLWEKCEGFREFLTSMWGSMYKGMAHIYNFSAECYNKMMEILEGLMTGTANAFSAIVNTVANAAIAMIKSGNGIIGIFKKIIDAYNTVASALGGPTVDANIALSTEGIESIRDTALDIIGGLPDFSDRKELIDIDAWEDRVDTGMSQLADFTLSGYISDKLSNVNSAIKNSIEDTNSLLDSVTNTTGGKGGSGKAIKTTSNDDLLSDEDIQLLLDIATRDYKLTYQQVTPNITLTFGDIRETADVDDILDQVADRLEEIYDSDLEVPVSD